MKYTKYDIKSNKKKNDDWKTTLLMIVSVIILALLIGSFIFFKMFPPNMKNSSGENKTQVENTGENINKPEGGEDVIVPPVDVEKEENEKENEQEEKDEGTKNAILNEYTMVQCGYFTTKEGAQSVKTTIGKEAKILTEDGKFRVVRHIGTEDDAVTISEDLTGKEVDNTKTRFKLDNESKVDKGIIEIIKNSLEFANKLEKGEATSIKTGEFKAWVNKLEEDTNDDKYNNFKILKDSINALPEELKITDVENLYQISYDVLRAYK